MYNNDEGQGYYGNNDNNGYNNGGYRGGNGGYRSNRGGYSDRPQPEDVHSVKIELERKTFYVDLKKGNDYFVKVSEKSNKGRSTIVIDATDFAQLLNALKEVDAKLNEINGGETSEKNTEVEENSAE